MPKRKLEGIVISDKAEKTLTVLVKQTVRHNRYPKTITKNKKYAVHDPNSLGKVGDKVEIIENKPISKTKKWLLINNSI